MSQCKLLGGSFAFFLQFMIAFLAGIMLLYKRAFTEYPKRPLVIWLMDVSKQGFSSVLIHFWNVFMSIILSKLSYDDKISQGRGDECAFYLLIFFIDTIVGVYLLWILVNFTSRAASYYNIASLQTQGYYGNPPSWQWYIVQLFGFLFQVILCKTLLGVLVYAFQWLLKPLSYWMFASWGLDPNIELVVVLVVFPTVLSFVQVTRYRASKSIYLSVVLDTGQYIDGFIDECLYVR